MALGAALQAGATEPATIGETAISEKIDSILQNSDKLDGLVRRSIMNGGSKPVSFAGEADAKLIASSFFTAPQWMQADRTEFKNSSVTLRMAMVAKPHRNLTLWSKLAFNNALMGYTKRSSINPTYSMTDDTTGNIAASSGDANDKRPVVLYEDMCAGMIMSAGPVSFNFKAGGVLWNEMSPLTVWKTQPRMFGWDYLPYELEQSTAMFYDYATVKGFKEGRAAWNKKPFQGLQLESIELPWNLYLNTLYGFYEGYNKNYPWLVPADKTNELQYTADPSGSTAAIPLRTSSTKGFGIGDTYRPVWFLRLAKGEIPGGVTAGVNWFQYLVDDDYSLQWSTRYGYTLTGEDAKASVVRATRPGRGAWVAGRNGLVFNADTSIVGSSGQYFNNYYIEPRVGSIDFRRNIPGGLSFHVDVGASNVDSVWYKVSGASATRNYTADEFANGTRADSAACLNEWQKYDPRFQDAAMTALPYQEIGRSSTGWKPAVYATVSYPFTWAEVELRSIYADKDFHSGASTVGPINGIFPYESNLTGPGKFAGVDNGTSYSSNLVGSNLIVKLPIPRGHARVSVGFHTQIEKSDDIVYFPWRQNGAAYNATMNSDFTRYGVGLLDDFWRSTADANNTPSDKRMIRRLGDESFFRTSNRNPYAPVPGFAGGMRADYMAIYEGFATYKLSSSYAGSLSDRIAGDRTLQRAAIITAFGAKPRTADSVAWLADSAAGINKYLADSLSWFKENPDYYDIVANQDSAYFRLQHKKATQNFSLDLSYEISRLWEGKRSVFLAGYAAFNSVTNGPGMGIPAFTTGNDVLLVGRNLRFEPVFQLTPRFYIIGLVSQEIWKSDYGVSIIDSTSGLAPSTDLEWLVSTRKDNGTLDASRAGLRNLRRAPIDYTDWMYGLGFDWDIAPRVSLHVRGQYFTHEDVGISVDLPSAAGRNDYRAWMGSTEMKMWF